MEKYFSILKNVELFGGIDETELNALLTCLNAKAVHFEKGRTVFMPGAATRSFGVVLSGSVQISHEDYYGNRSILGNVGPGGLFGESFAFAEAAALPVGVVASQDSEILFIDCKRLVSPCANACSFHNSLIRNMLSITAKKNIALTQKIEINSKRGTREKLLAYLSGEAQRAGSSSFEIPFDRQELADYLSVDRSAMSAELGKMRNDGLLLFHKNRFELL